MRHLVSGIHQPSVASFGFRQISPPLGFGETWMSYEVPEEVGAGNYHLYSPTGQWSIAIHDFTLARDSPLSFTLPDYVSVTWYESIAGEQYDPPRVLRSDHVAGYCSRPTGWHALVRGQVPIRSVGVEVTPEYSHRYLDAEYGGQFSGVADAFESLNTDGSNWPQLRAKLMRLWPRRESRRGVVCGTKGRSFRCWDCWLSGPGDCPTSERPEPARTISAAFIR